jgi:hypothetical protein
MLSECISDLWPFVALLNSSVGKELTCAGVLQVAGISYDAFAIDSERFGSRVAKKLEKISGSSLANCD